MNKVSSSHVVDSDQTGHGPGHAHPTKQGKTAVAEDASPETDDEQAVPGFAAPSWAVYRGPTHKTPATKRPASAYRGRSMGIGKLPAGFVLNSVRVLSIHVEGW